MLRLAANISTLFTALPLGERFAAAASAGFSAVEMQFPYTHKPAELAAAARNAGTDIVLINMPAGDFAAGERGIACIPGRETEFATGIAQAINYATALNCPRINCLAGNIPSGAGPQTCWDMLVTNLRDAADALASRNIQLLIEPLNRTDNPSFILNGTNDAAALITAVGKDNLALQFDIYHSATAGEDAFAQLQRHISQIGHIQISDAPGRGAPGTGTLDFARLFRMLPHLPYESWTGCEYFDPEPDFVWMQNYALTP
jgi:hydroxypyruvate isomerase